jgi:hypothetical protein
MAENMSARELLDVPIKTSFTVRISWQFTVILRNSFMKFAAA